MIAENGNLWAFGIRPEPRLGAYSSPQIPLLLEMGLLPPPKNPTPPALCIRPRFLALQV